MKSRLLLVIYILVFAVTGAAQDRWVATWAASPQSATFNFPRPKQDTAAPKMPAAPANSSAQSKQPPPFALPPNIQNQTVRMVVRASIGGDRVRVRVSNTYGTGPLTIGAARIAQRDKESSIIPASDRTLTFSGKSTFVVPPGALIVSDPVDLHVPKLGDLVISIFIPGDPPPPTVHLTGLHTTYISQPGNFTAATTIPDATMIQSWYWISGVDVLAPPRSELIVAFGDSITDGATSTPDEDRSWPSQLAERLVKNKATAQIAIVNQGISGNRLLGDGAGVSALARFDRDVLCQPGVKWLIVLEGINDIGMGSLFAPSGSGSGVTAEDLISAHKQMIERAHIHGVRAIGATLLPYGGAAYYSEPGESIREAVNNWIRTGGAYDAVIDFDAKLRDPKNPKELNPAYFINDHLHPNDAGYKLMAEAVDLSIFKSTEHK
jgi:lysophospholipase L1-like esterase